jgi:hypothetical protein
MSRFLVIPLVALALVSAVPAGDVPVAPRAVASKPVRVAAPFPHLPGERDLTIEDIGIEVVLPPLDRIENLTVPNPKDPIGVPDLPPLPGIKLPPSLDSPSGFGQPGGAGDDPPKLPVGPFPGRSGAAKAKYVKQNGGTEESEKAVALGLAWLAKQQKPDGSWVFDKGNKEDVAAATGFALLAFLGAGETHKAPKEKEEKEERKYQKTVAAGVGYLMKLTTVNGAKAGRISANAYPQGIAALALIEAYGMTKDPALKPYAQAAVNYIQKSQGGNGSWGYSAGANGDVSISGWQIQALFAAKQSKELVVDDKVIKKAVKFLDAASAGKQKSMYGYADNAGATPGTALTASGLWSRCCIDGWGPETPGLKDGVAGLLKNQPASGGVQQLYYVYYATLVLKNYGGEEWTTWNEGPKTAEGTRKGGVRDWLVSQQVKKDGADLGSWDPEAGWYGTQCGRLGTTAICIINLEAYYRYVPPVPAEKKDDKKPADPNK